MKGVVYVRVSDYGQIDGTSLDTQQDACIEYAEKNNIPIEKIFVEEGESAKFSDRTQLLELIEYCRKQRNIGALIVWKLDRFARWTEDHFSIKRELAKYGTRIYSVTEPITDDPVGRFTETMLAATAQFDNEIRAVRSIRGMQRKIQEGIFPWKPPRGYLSANPPGSKKRLPDIPDPKPFAIIKEGWRLVLTGNYRKAEIVRLFNERGLRTDTGKMIPDQVIDFIFQNKYYAGVLFDPWGKKEYPGLHEPMITPDEFALAQEILSRRSNSRPHVKERSDFILRGFARCPTCLRPLTGSWSKGRNRRYPYYHCYSKKCPTYGHGLNRETLENEFKANLRRYTVRPALLPVLKARIIKHYNLLRSGHEQEIVHHNNKIRILERENHELIRMRRQSLISDAEFKQEHDKLNADIESARARLARVAEVSRFDDTDLQNVLITLTSLPETWDHQPVPFRQRFQQIIFPEGFVPGRVGTAKISYAMSVLGHPPNEKTNVVRHNLKFWNRFFEDLSKLIALFRTLGIDEQAQGETVSNSER